VTSKIVPKLHTVPENDIADLLSLWELSHDLLEFWRITGAGDFNLKPDGSRYNEIVSNRLLDAEDVLDLIEDGDPEILALLEFGMPFFNTLDRDYILIAGNGEVIEVSPSGAKRLICPNVDEFIKRILAEPLFYEER
jgi:hypothetical protein